jgi:ankyrin repeat protein
VEVVKALLDKGAEVDKVTTGDGGRRAGLSPLYVASRDGHGGVVKLLLDRGGDANIATGDDGTTPLHWAARNGHVAVMKMLLDAGADVNISGTDVGENTPLYLASCTDRVDVVEMLLSKGAEVDKACPSNGVTPLHRASEEGHIDVVRMLLDRGADVNTSSSIPHGSTPLYAACREGHMDVVEMLLGEGVEANFARPGDGITPLYTASKRGHLGIVRVLLGKVGRCFQYPLAPLQQGCKPQRSERSERRGDTFASRDTLTPPGCRGATSPAHGWDGACYIMGMREYSESCVDCHTREQVQLIDVVSNAVARSHLVHVYNHRV